MERDAITPRKLPGVDLLPEMTLTGSIIPDATVQNDLVTSPAGAYVVINRTGQVILCDFSGWALRDLRLLPLQLSIPGLMKKAYTSQEGEGHFTDRERQINKQADR